MGVAVGGVGSKSKNCHSHHLYNFTSELKGSNAHWALLLNPVSEDEKSEGPDEKSLKRNIA